MYSEEELLPISALQHLVFCERQWALIHIENLWEENPLTLEGRFLHQRVDESGTEVRGSLRIVRALPIRSMRHGLVGKADVVEFHRVPKDENSQHQAISLKNATGLWAPVPVEYKRGRPKFLNCDKIQLCAQALCLEEMLNLHIPEGRIFYGKTQKRLEVLFDHPLREDTRKWIIRLHEQSQRGVTPPASYEKKCDQCSLIDQCLPKATGNPLKARTYLQKALEGILKNKME